MTKLEKILKQAEKAANVAKPIMKAVAKTAEKQTVTVFKHEIPKKVVIAGEVVAATAVAAGATYGIKKVYDKHQDKKAQEEKDQKADEIINRVEDAVNNDQATTEAPKAEETNAPEQQAETTSNTEQATTEAPKAEETNAPEQVAPQQTTADPEKPMYFVPGLGYVQIVTPTPEMMAQMQQNAQPNPAFQMKREMDAADQAPVEEAGAEKITEEDKKITAADVASGKVKEKSEKNKK